MNLRRIEKEIGIEFLNRQTIGPDAFKHVACVLGIVWVPGHVRKMEEIPRKIVRVKAPDKWFWY